MKARTVFEKLKRTSAYTHGASEEVKRAIFESFWQEKESAQKLRQDFFPNGWRGKDSGFGYVVEEFAKRSARFPKNTKAASHLAGLILGALHTGGDEALVAVARMYNPDFLWIELRGRKAEITGIGEVKSSLEAYLKKPDQIALQENSIRKALQSIERDKRGGIAHEFFRKRKATIREPLRKVMIVPAGVRGKIKKHLPEEWECVEIEFSYEELVFIAQHLWPEFRPEAQFEEGFLGQFEREFLAPFIEWGARRLNIIFRDSNVTPFPSKEILLLACLAKKIPLSDEGVLWAKTLMADENLCGIFSRHTNTILGLKHLNQWEAKFLEKFLALFGGSERMKQFILLFLTNRREAKDILAAWARSEEKLKKIERMEDVELLSL